MENPQRINPSSKGNIFPALFVCASLILNVYLAAQLLKRKPALPAVASATADSFRREETIASPDSLTKVATLESPASPESVEPTFHWSAMESSDYRQYIANLRAAGVSEQVIRDIIVADVSQHFNKRAKEIWQPRPTAYWQKYNNEQPNPKQMEEMSAMSKEHGNTLKELLGVRMGQQEMIDTVYLQIHGHERELLLLSPDKREAAMAALADADIEAKVMKLHSTGSYSTRDEQKLFNEKLKLLADVLSPEELEEFHQRNSPFGVHLKSEVRYLGLSSEEYKQLLAAKESSGDKLQTKDAVQKLFGEERAKEFERTSSAFYINARTGAEAEGIPLDRVDQAAKLATDSTTAAFTTLQDKTLSVEERKAKLKELQIQTEAKIKELLGDKASKLVVRDLNNLMRSQATYIKP